MAEPSYLFFLTLKLYKTLWKNHRKTRTQPKLLFRKASKWLTQMCWNKCPKVFLAVETNTFWLKISSQAKEHCVRQNKKKFNLPKSKSSFSARTIFFTITTKINFKALTYGHSLFQITYRTSSPVLMHLQQFHNFGNNIHLALKICCPTVSLVKAFLNNIWTELAAKV